jgi:hypothetical protein
MVLICRWTGKHGITEALNALKTLKKVRNPQWIQCNQCFSDSPVWLRFIKITSLRQLLTMRGFLLILSKLALWALLGGFFPPSRGERSPALARIVTPWCDQDDDALYIADRDNGLYRYSYSREAYTGFYPAHRGPTSQAYLPQLVQSPEGVVPLFHPIAIAATPSGQLMVQEHVSGRISILSGLYMVYLPMIELQP